MIEAVKEQLNVSRETMVRLQQFATILLKWNTAINLISKASQSEVWSRHILDSAQIFAYGHTARIWADFGSGGGFPGVVVAILAAEQAPQLRVVLVESDQRKAAFLRQVSTTLGLQLDVLSDRIETLPSIHADVISARALAPLSQLCRFASLHCCDSGSAIFLKGRSATAEIAEARKEWSFSLDLHPSVTDPAAVVMVLKDIRHV